MRMSHVYQPVMLEALLRGGGFATVRDIAAAILAHDESQIDYYTEIVKRMPGKVLTSHGIIRREGDGYQINANDLTDEERVQLISSTSCRRRVQGQERRVDLATASHRHGADSGSGSIRDAEEAFFPL
jgi:hypothetical protein